jgi:hypothetical protein
MVLKAHLSFPREASPLPPPAWAGLLSKDELADFPDKGDP